LTFILPRSTLSVSIKIKGRSNMLDVTESSFNFGSGTISYKGVLLGESSSIKIKRKTSIHEVKKDSSSVVADASIIIGIRK